MCPHVTRSSTGWNHQPIITKDQHQTTTYNNCNNFPKASTSIGTAWRLVFEGLARLAPTNPTNPRGKKSAPRCTTGDHRVPLGSLQHGPQSRFPDQWSPNSMQSPHPNLVAAAKRLTRILVSWCFVCFMGFMPTYGKYPRIWFRYDSVCSWCSWCSWWGKFDSSTLWNPTTWRACGHMMPPFHPFHQFHTSSKGHMLKSGVSTKGLGGRTSAP